MEIVVEKLEEGFTCLRLKGRLDLKGTQTIEKEFGDAVQAAGGSVLVDMSEVEFLASIGIRLLLSSVKQLAANQHKLVVLKPKTLVEEILKLAGLDTVCPIVHDDESALKRLKGDPS